MRAHARATAAVLPFQGFRYFTGHPSLAGHRPNKKFERRGQSRYDIGPPSPKNITVLGAEPNPTVGYPPRATAPTEELGGDLTGSAEDRL